MNDTVFAELAVKVLRAKGSKTENTAVFPLLGESHQQEMVDKAKQGLEIDLAEAYCRAQPETRTYMLHEHAIGRLALPVDEILGLPYVDSHNALLEHQLDQGAPLPSPYWFNRVVAKTSQKEFDQIEHWCFEPWPELLQRLDIDQYESAEMIVHRAAHAPDPVMGIDASDLWLTTEQCVYSITKNAQGHHREAVGTQIWLQSPEGKFECVLVPESLYAERVTNTLMLPSLRDLGVGKTYEVIDRLEGALQELAAHYAGREIL